MKGDVQCRHALGAREFDQGKYEPAVRAALDDIS